MSELPATAKATGEAALPPATGYADPCDDPEYQKWIEEMAQHCRCTPISERPCAGVCAGGLCDEMHWDDPWDAPDKDYEA